MCRRRIEKKADAEFALRDKSSTLCSMSSRTIVYKGMLVATQMRRFFIRSQRRRRQDGRGARPFALLHQHHAQLGACALLTVFIIHNGEINTLKGNVNWIRAREPNLIQPRAAA